MSISEEKLRGGLTTVITGILSGLLTFVGVKTGLSAPVSAAIFLYGVGSLVSYSMDILFAKTKFPNQTGKLVAVPYTAFSYRLQYLTRSFLGPQFMRFVITVILDTLIGIALLRAAIKYMDEHKILMDFPWRNTITSLLIASITFIVYVNVLRFDWAYQETNNLTLNIIIFMWLTIVLLIFTITYADDKDSVVKVADVKPDSIPILNRWGVSIYDLS